jgi:hypothetical protein
MHSLGIGCLSILLFMIEVCIVKCYDTLSTTHLQVIVKLKGPNMS